MTTVNVNSSTGLLAALKVATPGETIDLAAGTYSNLSIYNYKLSGVTVTSANPSNPAIIAGLKVNTDSGITFSNIQFSTVGDSDSAYVIRVQTSSNITFAHDVVTGVSSVAPISQLSGLYVTGSTGVDVNNSKFQYLFNGIAESGNNNVTFSNNAFQYLGNDGIDNTGSSNVLISHNNFTDFETPVGPQHPDAIQFWTSSTTTADHNITINSNVYDRGTGSAAQGIFMRGTAGDPQIENVTISNNAIIGGMYDTIYVDQVSGAVSITNNVVSSWTGVNLANGTNMAYSGRIMLGDDSKATVTMTGNQAQAYTNMTSLVPMPAGNTLLGADTNQGHTLLTSWQATHSADAASFSNALVSVLGLSNVHSTVGLL